MRFQRISLVSSTAALVMMAVAGLGGAARGEPLTPGNIPATARWVVHVDMDAARDSALWKLVQKKFIEPHQASFDQKVQIVETITGMRFPRDLHDVTLYGPSFAKDDACIVVHAAVNQATVMDLLKLDPEFRSETHNDHEVLTWRDKDKDRLLYGAFFGQDRAILSPVKKHVEAALDAMDGKVAVLKADSPLAAFPAAGGAVAGAGKEATIVYVAGQGLSGLKKEQDPMSPVVAQTQAGWLAISEVNGRIVGKAALETKTEQSAQQIQSFVDGMKALVTLTASGEKADDKVKAVAAALGNLNLRRDGAVISADIGVSVETLKNLIETHHIGEGPEAAPVKAPAKELP
jgi:hypothetical protein